MIVAVTGHRPDKLPEGYNGEHKPIRMALSEALDEVCVEYGNIERMLSGMALGFDQIACEVALNKHVLITGCIPCFNQDRKWIDESKKYYRELIKRISEAGGDFVIVTEEDYTPYCMIVRDHYMVDNCDLLIALWNGTEGGTEKTVKYAKKKGVTVKNIWDKIGEQDV
jgi:uncharacterized phage-like protein YoqJ